DLRSLGLSKRSFKVFSVTVSSLSSTSEASNYIPAAPIFLPEGPWQQIPGEVTAAKGFKAAGMYGGLRAKGEKPELALVGCDVDATVAVPELRVEHLNFTKFMFLLDSYSLLICAFYPRLLKLKPEEVLIESTGVIGQRINKVWIIDSTVKKSLLSQLAMMLQFMCYEPCSFKDE
ncbi:hypothetical protein H0E87_025515, partial [Populus deltoides]